MVPAAAPETRRSTRGVERERRKRRPAEPARGSARSRSPRPRPLPRRRTNPVPARVCRSTAARSPRRRCAPRAQPSIADRLPHSLHGYFLRPGRVDRPVILHVDRDRDGGSFSARHVRAVQDGEVIFSMVASFHRQEDSGTFDAVPTRGGPDAETLSPRPSPFLVEVREVTPTRVGHGQVRHSDSLWVRASAPLPDDPLVHACALAYVSDLGSGLRAGRGGGPSRRRSEHRSQLVVPRSDPGRRMDAARALAVESKRLAWCVQRLAAQRRRATSASC